MSNPRVLVVGAGRVGSALSRALHDAGMPGALVSGRDRTDAAPRLAQADLLVLAVPDRAVAEVAADVAVDLGAVLAGDLPGSAGPGRGAAARLAPWSPPAVVHCCGALGLDVLAPLAALGASTGCWHPLQAFPSRHTRVDAGITWAITASAPLDTTLRELTERVHGIPLFLREADKPRYHAAAALASNYSVTLVAHATAVLQDCGLDRDGALAATLALVRSTLHGLAEVGLPDGLTGPLARGDVGTVSTHLRALAAYPDMLALYRAAGLATVPLLADRGMPPEEVERVREVLDAGPGKP